MSWSNHIARSDSDKNDDITPYIPKEVFPLRSEKQPALSHDSIGGSVSALERETYERAFESGRRAGLELGIKEMETSHRVLSTLIGEMEKLKIELIKESEKDILKIAVAVARCILRDEIDSHPDKTIGYVQEAINKIGQSEKVLIRVNPQEIERLRNEQTGWIECVQGVKWLRFEPDDSIPAGECIVESRDRIVDARIDSQLSVIENDLHQSLE